MRSYGIRDSFMKRLSATGRNSLFLCSLLCPRLILYSHPHYSANLDSHAMSVDRETVMPTFQGGETGSLNAHSPRFAFGWPCFSLRVLGKNWVVEIKGAIVFYCHLLWGSCVEHHRSKGHFLRRENFKTKIKARRLFNIEIHPWYANVWALKVVYIPNSCCFFEKIDPSSWVE